MKSLKLLCTTFIVFTICNANLAFATSSQVKKNKVASECIQLFKQAESLVAQAEQQPGTHTNLVKIKNTLNKSKQEILELDVLNQTKSCAIGLAKLNKATTTANNNSSNVL